jgi:hypothetical protein
LPCRTIATGSRSTRRGSPRERDSRRSSRRLTPATGYAAPTRCSSGGSGGFAERAKPSRPTSPGWPAKASPTDCSSAPDRQVPLRQVFSKLGHHVPLPARPRAPAADRGGAAGPQA